VGMAKSPAQIRRELLALRRAFLAQLPDRVQAIETALNEALGAGEIDRPRVDALFQLAHRLCGSAGIYGHPAVQAAAGAIERVAEGLWDAGGKDEPSQVAELRQLVEALKRAVADAQSGSATKS
jgi:HPt (histidine-containing phosphotransfer) domain-containing protein